MGLIAIDPKGTFDYILEEQRDDPEPTIFKLKILSARELAKIEDGALAYKSSRIVPDREGEFVFRSGSNVLRILNLGLWGWENLRNGQGEEVPFRWHVPNKEPHTENLDWLRPEWRRELADAITEMHTLNEHQVKNSGSSSESP